jgi:hypothetical protein
MSKNKQVSDHVIEQLNLAKAGLLSHAEMAEKHIRNLEAQNEQLRLKADVLSRARRLAEDDNERLRAILGAIAYGAFASPQDFMTWKKSAKQALGADDD